MSGPVRLTVKEGQSNRGSNGGDQDSTSKNDRRSMESGGVVDPSKQNWGSRWRQKITGHGLEVGLQKAKQAIIFPVREPQILPQRLSSLSSLPSPLPRWDSECSSDGSIERGESGKIHDGKYLYQPQTMEDIDTSDEEDEPDSSSFENLRLSGLPMRLRFKIYS